MSAVHYTRRDFLAESSRAAGAGWMLLQLPLLASLVSCAREGTRGNAFTWFAPGEAQVMRAFAAQVIPSDDGAPGAEEAGVVHFIDRALGLPFYADRGPIIRAGLADLDVRSRAAGGFAALSGAQQIDVLRQIEHERFFAVARTLVVMGMLADPSHGGNRDMLGWKMIGMEHHPTYTAPFGWYDAQAGADSTTHAE